MKFIYFFVLTTTFCFSQKTAFNTLNENESYIEYLTKNNDILKLGDTLIIGIPTTQEGFNYISQGGQKVSHTLAMKKVIVTKLKTYGSQKNGYKMYVHFKGYGLLPVLIDYETAFDLGEIINPNASLSKKQAIEKLKETKELLELGVIKIDDYTKIKEELTKIILK